MDSLFADSKENEEPPLEFLLRKDSRREDLVAKVDSDGERYKDIPDIVPYPSLMSYQPYSRPNDDAFGIMTTFADDILLSFSKDPDSIEYFISMVRSVKLDYAES